MTFKLYMSESGWVGSHYKLFLQYLWCVCQLVSDHVKWFTAQFLTFDWLNGQLNDSVRGDSDCHGSVL